MRALSRVADVVPAGPDAAGPGPSGTGPSGRGALVDPGAAVGRLRERGYRRILCGGGPLLFGAFQAADRVDELCLSLSPLLAAGPAPRITAGTEAGAGAGGNVQPLTLAGVLRGGDMLLLRYVRSPVSPPHIR